MTDLIFSIISYFRPIGLDNTKSGRGPAQTFPSHRRALELVSQLIFFASVWVLEMELQPWSKEQEKSGRGRTQMIKIYYSFLNYFNIY